MENDKCQFIKVIVKEKKLDGGMVVQERYIQQDSKRLDKHKQLKQRRLEQRLKRRNKPGSESVLSINTLNNSAEYK